MRRTSESDCFCTQLLIYFFLITYISLKYIYFFFHFFIVRCICLTKNCWTNQLSFLWNQHFLFILIFLFDFISREHFRQSKGQDIWPLGKKCRYKHFWNFILALNIKKWPDGQKSSEEGGQGSKGPCPQVNVPLYFPKMSLYFQNCLSFFRSVFFFLKNVLLFSRIALTFPTIVFLLFTSWAFFQDAFFPSDCTFCGSSSEILREIIFPLLLELFIDQLMIPCILKF